MKPMLKNTFFTTVNTLLNAGITPELQTSPLTCWGNLVWHDADGVKQVEPLYSAHDCSSTTARPARARFQGWFAEIMNAFRLKQIADKGIEVGTRVWDNRIGELRTVTFIRDAGVLVLDGHSEVELSDVRVMAPEAPAEPATPASTTMLKDVFFKLVNDARLVDCTPSVTWANVGEFAHVSWVDRSGEVISHPLYRTTARNADTMRKRFDSWMAEALTVEPLFVDELPPSHPGEEKIYVNGKKTPLTVTPETLYGKEWNHVQDIKLGSVNEKNKRAVGTASITTTDGAYRFDFDWMVEFGESAKAEGLPALTSVFGEPRLSSPKAEYCLLVDSANYPLDDEEYLDVVWELDGRVGFCAEIFNDFVGKAAVMGVSVYPTTPIHAVAEELYKSGWNAVHTINITDWNDRSQVALGSAILEDEHGLFQIAFDWSVDYSGAAHGAPYIVSFEGEPKFIAPANVVCDKPVMEVLETLDEELDQGSSITDQVLAYFQDAYTPVED